MQSAFARTVVALLLTTVLAVPGSAFAQPTGTHNQLPVGSWGQGDSATPVDVVAQADHVDFYDEQGNEMSMFVPGYLSSNESPPPERFGSADGAAVAEGVTRYAGTANYDVLIHRRASGFDAVINIANEHAPHRYEFDLDLPMGWTLSLNAQGAVSINDERGEPQVAVAPPWALDASGNAVPTHFELNGTVLVQVVDHRGALYPVLADPSVTVGRNIYLWLWGWEVAALYGAGAAGLAAFFCAVYGALHPVMCAVTAASATGLATAVGYFYLQPGAATCRFVIAFRPWGAVNYMERLATRGCSYSKYELPG